MRPKRPYVASLDQVRITRTDQGAEIDYAEPGVRSTHFLLGPRARAMTDQEILDEWNEGVRGTEALRLEYEHVAVEIPPGKPQLADFPPGGYWTPRGDVLRCVIGPDRDGGPAIEIDGRELSWEEFGRALSSYEGWGMRIVFVPDDETHLEPRIEVREPEDEEG